MEKGEPGGRPEVEGGQSISVDDVRGRGRKGRAGTDGWGWLCADRVLTERGVVCARLCWSVAAFGDAGRGLVPVLQHVASRRDR